MTKLITDNYYADALLIRRTEDNFLDLFNQGKMNGTIHTSSGQEFSAIAFTSPLKDEDFIFSNHRCHGHYLAHTRDLNGLVAELMGKESGTCGGVGSSQHLYKKNFYSNGVQGGIVPVAAGMSLAAKKNNSKSIGLVFIGDGTLGEGVVYETFNLCSLMKIPLLIVCENNQYAQSTKIKDNLSGKILDRPKAFGIETFHSNTWDLKKLFSNAKESINFVRNSNLPAFHLIDTYRLNHHSKSDDNRDPEEVKEYVKKDPLNLFKAKNPKKFNSMLKKVNEQISNATSKADTTNELDGIAYIGEEYNEENSEFISLEVIGERVSARINLFFHEILSKDRKVLFVGEDILSPYGGAFKIAKSLSDKFPDNIISTPISELSITGLCNGLALGGYRPFLEIMFGDFITLCLDQIINHASKFYHMYNKQINCPVVFRTPMGGGRGYGPSHSQTLDRFLVGIDNTSVIAINSFIDPKLIYESIYKNEQHPTIVIENKLDYARFVGDKKNNSYKISKNKSTYPVVKCSPKSIEPDLTIVSYGGIASDIFQSLDQIFQETELISELLVLSRISPLDIKAIVASVKRTKKLVVIEEGVKEFGVGAEILSRISEELGGELEISKRIGAKAVPIPSSRSTEDYVLPNTTIAMDIKSGLNL